MPMFCPTPAEFRAWLKAHHATERELIVGFYRKDCGRPSITWPESVEEALCFGWIDGVRRKIDDESYTIRFTPRKPTSIWSKINLGIMQRLIEEKRVAPAGRKVYDARNAEKTNRYAYEREAAPFDPAHEKLFRKNAKAWKFWEAQVPSYRKPAVWWVGSGKQEATREKRLRELIDCSAKGLKIARLRRSTDKQP
jgi:uncharacterized protein YdeI (YjbR/CyaY-like superfamily)